MRLKSVSRLEKEQNNISLRPQKKKHMQHRTQINPLTRLELRCSASTGAMEVVEEVLKKRLRRDAGPEVEPKPEPEPEGVPEFVLVL